MSDNFAFGKSAAQIAAEEAAKQRAAEEKAEKERLRKEKEARNLAAALQYSADKKTGKEVGTDIYVSNVTLSQDERRKAFINWLCESGTVPDDIYDKVSVISETEVFVPFYYLKAVYTVHFTVHVSAVTKSKNWNYGKPGASRPNPLTGEMVTSYDNRQFIEEDASYDYTGSYREHPISLRTFYASDYVSDLLKEIKAEGETDLQKANVDVILSPQLLSPDSTTKVHSGENFTLKFTRTPKKAFDMLNIKHAAFDEKKAASVKDPVLEKRKGGGFEERLRSYSERSRTCDDALETVAVYLPLCITKYQYDGNKYTFVCCGCNDPKADNCIGSRPVQADKKENIGNCYTLLKIVGAVTIAAIAASAFMDIDVPGGVAFALFAACGGAWWYGKKQAGMLVGKNIEVMHKERDKALRNVNSFFKNI